MNGANNERYPPPRKLSALEEAAVERRIDELESRHIASLINGVSEGLGYISFIERPYLKPIISPEVRRLLDSIPVSPEIEKMTNNFPWNAEKSQQYRAGMREYIATNNENGLQNMTASFAAGVIKEGIDLSTVSVFKQSSGEYRLSVDPEKDPNGTAKLENVQLWLEAQQLQETGAKTSIKPQDNHITIKNPGHVISHELKVAYDKQLDGLRQQMAGAMESATQPSQSGVKVASKPRGFER